MTSTSLHTWGPQQQHEPVADPLQVLIQADPHLAERLRATHIDDGTGRCRACSSGGQTGHYRWPCTLYRAAGGVVPRRRI